jgi:hypothetical protein
MLPIFLIENIDIPMEVVEAIEQLPEQGFDGVLVNGEVKLLSMMPDNLLRVCSVVN